MATKVLRAGHRGVEGQAARGSPAPFSPRSRSPRSSRWRASCPRRTTGRWGASRALSCTAWSSSRASPTRRRRRSGAGCTTARSSRGSSARGSSRATRTSSPRPAACSTSTRGALRVGCCTPASTSSAPMRSPSCRRSRVAIETVAGRAGSPGAGRVRVQARRHAGLPGRLGRPSRPDLRPLRAQDRDRAVRPARRAGHDHRALRVGQDACSGSSTTAPATPARPRSRGCRTPTPTRG